MRRRRSEPAIENPNTGPIELWTLVGFATAKEAVEEFFTAYPHIPADEHLPFPRQGRWNFTN